ncbi:arrestin domain-containing protein 3-like [Clupea harengus]|uniref:Arrestin domain-containing protein 3-like n=1 Tax=Clupea harengus TaxID=7950 RepID=A0A6P8FDG5_CLUHA|nr:arrestin domain-containing protein 3-like [Clupea harengus]
MFGKTLKNFSVNFFSPNPRGTFSGGETVSGEISFELTQDTKIQNISMALKGKAKVSWAVRRGGKRRVVSAKVELFNLKSYVLQIQNDEIVLKQGIHVYPFSCQIPHGDFPSSFVAKANGRISYKVIFGIHRSWHVAKEFESEFKFESHVASDPELLMPMSAANSRTICGLWCTSGSISMVVRLERKGYAPGDIIKISAEIGNGSSRSIVPKAALVQKQIFYTLTRSRNRVLPNILVCTMGQAVKPNISDFYLELTLAIPDDAPLSIANCEILEVEYVVMVTLLMKGCSSLETLFPIVLWGTPLH